MLRTETRGGTPGSDAGVVAAMLAKKLPGFKTSCSMVVVGKPAPLTVRLAVGVEVANTETWPAVAERE